MKLYKKIYKYVDKDDNERTGTSFYLELGNAMIRIEPRFFKDPVTGRDPNYAARKAVMDAFAILLPTKKATEDADTLKDDNTDDDSDLPF